MSTTLADNPSGMLWQTGNETFQDSKILDASKFRVGAPVGPGSGGGGAFSFDLLDFGGRARTEVAVLVGAYDGQRGEVGLSIWDGSEPFGDAAQKKVVEFRADRVKFKVPVLAPSFSVDPPSVLRSPNGRLELVAQDDGNLVLYANGVPIRALFGLSPEQLW